MIKKTYTIHKIAEQHVNLTIESYLKDILHYSARHRQKITRIKGAIFLNGRTTFLRQQLKLNDTLKILQLTDQDYGVTPEQGEITILYEDSEMIVVNKPPFQLVHPTGNTTDHTLANYLAYNLQQRHILCTIRPIHRLDRDTSGCVVFAKTAAAQTILTTQLQTNQLKRSYLAIIAGKIKPPNGTIMDPIGRDPTFANRRKVTASGSPAITNYQTKQELHNATLLKIWLETGRTHQIRVHLAAQGHPLVGDKMYGKRSTIINRQALHASTITFMNLITNNPEIINAPLPADMQKLL